jgi:hypothetical protein
MQEDKIQDTRSKDQRSRNKEQGTRNKKLLKRSQDLNTKYKIQNKKYKLPEVREYLRKVLPGYKMPDYFLPWPEEAGKGLKISRAEFREWAEEELRKKTKDKRQMGN